MSNFIFTHWLENWHRLVPVFFMGKTPTAGSGKNSCFHHKLKGRKRPNKEDITRLKGGNCLKRYGFHCAA